MLRATTLLLLGLHAVGRENPTGSEFVEINTHHFSIHHNSQEKGRGIMRRHVEQGTEASKGLVDCGGHTAATCAECPQGHGKSWCNDDCKWTEEGECVVKEAAGAAPDLRLPNDVAAEGVQRTSDVKWGNYRFNYIPFTDKCTEAGVDTWEGKSFFETWQGTDTGLTITDGTTVQNGVAKETSKGLRIYKAACPNATAVKVGGAMEIPVGSTSVELVFGITRRCTGDCAPFMVSVLDAATDELKQRWCFNREGHSPDIKCDHNKYVPFEKWNRVNLDISNYTDFVTPIKLALEVYTSGDFRFLPTLPGEVGLGGRAMVLIDTLLFGPSERPDPDSTFKDTSLYCRQSMRDSCKENGWCLDKYRCYSGWCTEGKGRCNEERNCPDDSDEVGCEYKMGFRGEYFLNHARELHKDTDIDSLKHPDIRTLNQQIEFDADDFWSTIHARDNFAARWSGNITINTGGHYNFKYDHGATSGSAKLKVQGFGENSDKAFDVESDNWINLPAGDFQLTLSYIHLRGEPSMTLKYAGVDTRGQTKLVSKDLISATMTGSRCDTMQCASSESLVAKPDFAKFLCDGVPCKEELDTRTCCTRQYKVVSCGDHRTCALDMKGRPVCWGSWEKFNEEWKKHPGPFKDISTRGDYICAVKEEDGGVECWKPDNATAPLVSYSAGGRFTNVSVGGGHTCALRDSGYPACTGSNDNKQINPPSDLEFTRLASGDTFSCGISAMDLSVKCWGANERGQATPPTGREHYSYTHLAAGKSHACGISNGTVHCWGWNNNAQATPPTGQGFSQVAPGGMHTCGLKDNGEVVCWGANAEGQADPVKEDAPFLAVSSGQSHSCGIRASDREIVCWGSNFVEEVDGSLTWQGQSEPPPAGIWP